MRTGLVIGLSVMLMGCASTPEVDITPVSIEPVQTIKSDPFDVEEVFAAAQSDFKNENYLDALNGYKKVLAYDPQRKDALLGQGKVFLALGKYQQAARIFWDHSWTEDLSGERSFKIGKILSGIYTARYENSVNAINNGMVLSPDDPRLWNAKGHYHDKQGEWMEALASYIEAMKSGKWRAGTINNMGMSLLLQDRLEEAQDKFEQAIALTPGNKVYENNLRMVFILEGDLQAALDDIDEARSADILNDAGYVAMSRQKTNMARRLFLRALDISPIYHAKAQANLDKLEALETAARPETAGTSP